MIPTTDSAQIIGLDIGYGYTKATDGTTRVTLPSLVGPAVTVKYESDLVDRDGGATITLDGTTWFTGALARLQSPFTVSPRARERDPALLRLLTLAALHPLDRGTGPIRMITGLPVAWYADRERLAEALTGLQPARIDGEFVVPEIAEVQVIPQPFGSFFRTLLNPAGVMTDADALSWERVAVIDVGTHTTDYTLVDNLRYVEPRSTSIPVAMARVYELLQRDLAARFDLELDLHGVEAAVRAGAVRVYGSQRSIADRVNEMQGTVAQEILGEAATLWGRGRDLDAVLVTGGGGPVFADAIRRVYPHAQLVEDPQMANAEGFYRYARRKFGASVPVV